MARNRNRNRNQNTKPPPVSTSGKQAVVVNEPPRVVGYRQTQPNNYQAYQQGGIQIIARRNIASPTLLSTRWALNNMATNSPLRLLIMLADIDPDIALAIDNIITLICNPEDTQMTGMVESATGAGDMAPDPLGTANITSFLDNLPSEIGGLPGLMTQATMLTCFTGFNALDAVPGAPLQGLSRLWPVDSLTLHLARETQSGDAVVFQRQSGFIPQEFTDPLLPGYRRLNPETFFWNPWQPYVDEPYGRAMFAPALAEVLTYLAMLQDLRDSVHHFAWPRLKIGFNWSEMMKIAKEVMIIKDNVVATKWCTDQYEAMCAKVATMGADEALIHDTNGSSETLQGGSFAGLEAVMKELRSRIIRACKQLPVMMAFDGGHSGEGHTGIEWQIQAKRLEMLRSFVLRPICRAGTLHFRLQGLPLKCVAKVDKIRTTDALLDAQADEIRQRTAARNVLLGWKRNDQAAVETTGTGPSGPEDREALLLVAGGSSGTAVNPQTGGGTTQEETDASKGKGAK